MRQKLAALLILNKQRKQAYGATDDLLPQRPVSAPSVADRIAAARARSKANQEAISQQRATHAKQQAELNSTWAQQKAIRPGSAEERVLTGVKVDPAHASPSGAPPAYVTRTAADWKGLGSLGTPSNPGSGQRSRDYAYLYGKPASASPLRRAAGRRQVGGNVPGKAIGTP